MNFKTSAACASDYIREKAATKMTGENNPCSGCGETHDPADCVTGFNVPSDGAYIHLNPMMITEEFHFNEVDEDLKRNREATAPLYKKIGLKV